ncbi:hypothetical protein BpHYR1_020127 [Brachionus plicatilis]|uniref:RNA-directed DNA polymerase from mobile element jockey-like n=1 Tax=Brachionus plicatilis TaxID=10195 RepID=A0A3M7RY71_BRAPC|nr:hypothetical protein BpHYR1_020127 [Brachionus plicatilis]
MIMTCHYFSMNRKFNELEYLPLGLSRTAYRLLFSPHVILIKFKKIFIIHPINKQNDNNFILNRVVDNWNRLTFNALPPNVLAATSKDNFKKKLDDFLAVCNSF